MSSPKIKSKQIDTDDLGKVFVKKVVYEATISSSNWLLDNTTNMYTKVITVNGILPTDTPIIQPKRSTVTATDTEIMNSWFNIERITTGTNTITAYSVSSTLGIDIPVSIICYR